MEKKIIEIKHKPVVLNISYRTTKSLTIRVKNKELYCHAPMFVTEENIITFIKQNEMKISQLLDAYEPHAILEDGGYVDLFSKRYTISFKKGMNPLCIVKNQRIYASNKSVIEKYLKKCLETEINEMVEYFINKGLKIKKPTIQIRKMTSRYGSCTPAKSTIRFSYYLVHFTKPEIASVVIHELCHLIYPSHQKDFYDEVLTFFPKYREIEKQLKKRGLHE